MLLLGLILVFFLANVSNGLTYDDLARDTCFKKIYVCGDHRVSITGGTGHLVTDPYQFGEVCRRHKKFIACIEDAVNFCAGNFSDLALMILDNRRSVKMFCTDFEWKKNYFQSAPCINSKEQEVKDKCRIEEDERIDDRPWWCLIPEPCLAIQRVFECTVRKMVERCGPIAAEVFRRFHILIVENQDVVCKLRIQSPRYCRYQITKAPSMKEEKTPNPEESIKRIGPIKGQTSEIMNDLITASIIDSVSLLKKMKLLSLDSKEYVLKSLLTTNYKLKKLTDFYLSRETTPQSYSTGFVDEISLDYETENSDKTKTQIIKDSIYKLYKLFIDNKDLILFGKNHLELTLESIEFPIEHLSCFWLKSSQNSFKCEVKLLPVKQADKMDTKGFDFRKHFSNISTAADLEDLLNLVEFESALSDKENFKMDSSNKYKIDPLVFISIDDSIFISSLNSSNIRRIGFHLEDSDEEQNYDNGEDGKIKTTDSILKNLKQEFNMKPSAPKNCDEHPNTFKLNKINAKQTLLTHNSDQISDYQNEELQLRKLEHILNKRFQDVDIVSSVKNSKFSNKIFSEKLNEDSNYDLVPNISIENLLNSERCKINMNSNNVKSFNSNVETKLNINQILLELLNFVEV